MTLGVVLGVKGKEKIAIDCKGEIPGLLIKGDTLGLIISFGLSWSL